MSERGTYLGRPAAYWVEYLKSPDQLLRRLGCYALGEIGPDARDAAPALMEALHDPVPFIRTWAAAALAAVEPGHPDALATLLEATRDERGFVRSLAAWHLGRLGVGCPGVEGLASRLAELLRDPDRSVAKEAAIALRRLQCRDGAPRELGLL